MPLKSPIRWVGGKYKLRNQIVKMFPDCNSYTCYVEVFGGAGWVLFAKEPSPVEIFNDIEKELVNFFVVLRDMHEELIQTVLRFPLVNRSHFDQLNSQDPSALSQLDRAYRFYYLLMAGWGGEWENPRFQTSVTDFGNGNRLFGAFRNLQSRLSLASERISTVIIENLDWRECIERYDDSRTVMFLDPPYPGNSCNYSHNMLSIDEHHELARKLSTVKCRWILTSYDHDHIKSMYSDYHIFPVNFASGMDGENGRKNSEIIVTNYEVSENWHANTVELVTTPMINDEVKVVRGQYEGLVGFVNGIVGNLVEIKYLPFTKTNVISVNNLDVIVMKRFSDRRKFDRKIQNLRKDIIASISIETLLKLISLKEKGVIDNIPTYVSSSIHDAIANLEDMDEG